MEDNTMCAILLKKSGRYLNWYSKNWYQTTDEPVYIFPFKDCFDIFKILNNHYIHEVVLMSEDGEKRRLKNSV